ncbi:MAG: hypothetical protein H0Z34_10220 [Brevibacillus sp.]|nr:hypothetical protein [Brevibacillus sp.]
MQTKCREYEWGVFRAHFPVANQRRSSPGSLHDDPQGQRQNDVQQRRDAVAAAISLRIRRFAGRLAKPVRWRKTAHTRPVREL